MVRLRALDRKLLRDLVHARGQALAIALVVAGGVATFVMSISTMESLEAARAADYDRHHFADVFTGLERAPLALAERIAEIPGVARVEPRVATEATLVIPDLDEPASARLLSLPRRAGGLNEIHVRSGRSVVPGRRLEAVVSEPFAEAHGLGPGDALRAIVRGKLETLAIVGVGLSPEFVFQIRPGEFLPDHRRYAILWMDYEQLAPAVDMDGAFNDVTLRLQPGASEPAVIARLDRLLSPYGGLGAHGRDVQTSNEFVTNELRQLRGMALVPPSIFLAVAAFLLHVVVGRIIATQRDQIAVLRAFGYDAVDVGAHFLKLVLAIVAGGIALGVAGGAWLGNGMMALYAEYFRFPEAAYRLGATAILPAAGLATGAGIAGTLGAVRRAMRLPPAEAMRPEAPASFRTTVLERLGFERWLSPASRMILRNLERHPVKAALSAGGLALAVALLVLGTFFEDAIEHVLEYQFFRAQRQDVTVTFIEPASPSALDEIGRFPGVLRAEPFRSVPVTLRAGHRSRRLAVLGLDRDARLQRVLDAESGPVVLPVEGLAISEVLATRLGVGLGDRVEVEVMEGRRPVREVTIRALVRDYAGLSAWMDLDALRRWMEEGDVLSGAFLSLDARETARFHAVAKAAPVVLGVTTRTAAVRSFRETIAENLLVMRFFNVLFASVIAIGVVYNAARIALAERARELATLRILGFSRAEISAILLGELAVLVLLAILPGLAASYGLAAFVTTALATETQRFPLIVSARTYSFAVTVIAFAALASALLVRRRLDRLDLVAVLKSRE